MFEPVNDLERSLMRAALNPSYRPQFYRDLLEADIFIINYAESDSEEQNNTMSESFELKVPKIERNGQAWLPVFSSLQRLQEFISSETAYVVLKGRDFFELARDVHIVLNPDSDYGKEFIPQEIERMLDGSIFQPDQRYIDQEETAFLIGRPAVYPTSLVKALCEYFAKNKFVNRAYLVQFYNPKSGEPPHLLIAIDASRDWERIVGDAGVISSEVMGKDDIVDFMRLDDSDFSQHIINSTRPIYQKSFLKKLFGY